MRGHAPPRPPVKKVAEIHGKAGKAAVSPLTKVIAPPSQQATPPFDLEVLVINEESPLKDTLLFLEMKVGGHKLKAMVDCGASGNFISPLAAQKLSLKQVMKDKADTVRYPDGRTDVSTTVTHTPYFLGTFSDSETFHVLEMADYEVIWGRPWLRRINPVVDWAHDILTVKDRCGRRHKLHAIGDVAGQRIASFLINSMEVKRAIRQRDEVFLVTLKHILDADGKPVDSPLPQTISESAQTLRTRLDALVAEYRDVVPDKSDTSWMPAFPPERAITHKIELIPGAKLPNKAAYRMSQPELEELRRQLDDLLEKGYIQPSVSPHASPVILVRKPGSTALRMCVDYRMLNNATVKDAYPVPPLHECLDRLHGAKVFSKLDLAQGFHQIRLDPETVPLSAFRCRYGLFEFRTMPSGMANAPATLMRLMNNCRGNGCDVSERYELVNKWGQGL